MFSYMRSLAIAFCFRAASTRQSKFCQLCYKSGLTYSSCQIRQSDCLLPSEQSRKSIRIGRTRRKWSIISAKTSQNFFLLPPPLCSRLDDQNKARSCYASTTADQPNKSAIYFLHHPMPNLIMHALPIQSVYSS